jgi:uncharacterized membrane protein
MAIIEDTIDVQVPLHVAYDQWTRFEDFPCFMEGVEQVRQLTPTTLEWRATIAGVEKRWRARIVELVPDRRITWISTDGARNDGTVSFNGLGADRTRVNLLLDVEPDGPLETAGTGLGLLRNRLRGDLERFRDLVESPALATGGRRGPRQAATGEMPGGQATARTVRT